MPAAVEHALHALTECARSGEGNLLEKAVDAVRARATVGEVSDALEKVWGRFRATNQVISGVYGSAFGHGPGMGRPQGGGRRPSPPPRAAGPG